MRTNARAGRRLGLATPFGAPSVVRGVSRSGAQVTGVRVKRVRRVVVPLAVRRTLNSYRSTSRKLRSRRERRDARHRPAAESRRSEMPRAALGAQGVPKQACGTHSKLTLSTQPESGKQ